MLLVSECGRRELLFCDLGSWFGFIAIVEGNVELVSFQEAFKCLFTTKKKYGSQRSYLGEFGLLSSCSTVGSDISYVAIL